MAAKNMITIDKQYVPVLLQGLEALNQKQGVSLKDSALLIKIHSEIELKLNAQALTPTTTQ